VNRWTQLAAAIATALEVNNPDEGTYGKRDWALVDVLEALRDLALLQAVAGEPAPNQSAEVFLGGMMLRAMDQATREGKGVSRKAKRRRQSKNSPGVT
jgi:hypothetical protein